MTDVSAAPTPATSVAIATTAAGAADLITHLPHIDGVAGYLFGVPFSVVLMSIAGAGLAVGLHGTVQGALRIAATFSLNAMVGVALAEFAIKVWAVAAQAPHAVAFFAALFAQLFVGAVQAGGPRTLQGVMDAFLDALRKLLGVPPRDPPSSPPPTGGAQ